MVINIEFQKQTYIKINALDEGYWKQDRSLSPRKKWIKYNFQLLSKI